MRNWFFLTHFLKTVAGFEGPVTGEWDEYARFVGVDGVEIPAQVDLLIFVLALVCRLQLSIFV